MSAYWRHVFDPTLLFGAIGTLAILSLVFKENKFYRLFEHVFIGLALGFDLQQTWIQVLRPLFWDPMAADGQWVWVFTVPVGLMFYGIYTQRFVWMSRLIFGFFFGFSATTVFQGIAEGFFPQIVKSFKPLYAPHSIVGHVHRMAFVLNDLLFLVILFSVIIYFFFAFEQKSRAVRGTAQLGRLFLMLSFGAIFGATIMTRMALLIDRMYFIFVDWLRLAPH
jgi:hypothetical protein